MAEPRFRVVFVLGGPGSGKGTQCSRIVNDFGFVHLSAGDLLREERQNPESDVGEMIETYIREGRIVPVEVTVGLLKKAMEKGLDLGKNKFLIDGFPRNLDNRDGWERVIGSEASVEFLLFLECPEDVMEARLLQRGETSGRVDDNIESIRKRFATYMEQTMPIIEEYEKEGKVRRIQANQSVDQVYDEIRQIFALI